MLPTWLIEANVEGLPTEPVQVEIRRQGMTCHVVKHLPGQSVPRDIAGAESIPLDACVIFRGSLNLMRHIQTARRWRPGGWCSFANLACSRYYAHFGPFLLNREYAFLPIAEAQRLVDKLFTRYAVDGRLFMRPDGVDKSFAGTLADKFAFSRNLSLMSFDPTALILVARPRKLGREWRLIVAGHQVISGSQYRTEQGVEIELGCPDEVLKFAAKVIDQVAWRPDPVFVMDVCESEDGQRLVELNSFSCSGHYLADVSSVVEHASRLAGLS